jgi:hypothetical protein
LARSLAAGEAATCPKTARQCITLNSLRGGSRNPLRAYVPRLCASANVANMRAMPVNRDSCLGCGFLGYLIRTERQGEAVIYRYHCPDCDAVWIDAVRPAATRLSRTSNDYTPTRPRRLHLVYSRVPR